MPEVEISEEGNIRSLHLGSETIQISMDLDEPADLVLSYSRAMMGFLLWNDAPQHILQIGLGGGSFARFIDEYLPDAVSVAVDINPQVIAVARAFSSCRRRAISSRSSKPTRRLREDFPWLHRRHPGGWFRRPADRRRADHRGFLRGLQARAQPQGVFVTNWWSGDKRYQSFIERLLNVFEGRVLELPAASHGNVAVMAFRQSPTLTQWEALKKRADELEGRFGLEFVDFVSRLKMTNQHTAGHLLV